MTPVANPKAEVIGKTMGIQDPAVTPKTAVLGKAMGIKDPAVLLKEKVRTPWTQSLALGRTAP